MSWGYKKKPNPLGNTSYFHQKVHDISNFDNTEYFVRDLRYTLKSSLSPRPVTSRPSKSVTFEDEKQSALSHHRLSVKSDSPVKLSDLLDGIDIYRQVSQRTLLIGLLKKGISRFNNIVVLNTLFTAKFWETQITRRRSFGSRIPRNRFPGISH